MQRGACVTCARLGAGRRNGRNHSISFLSPPSRPVLRSAGPRAGSQPRFLGVAAGARALRIKLPPCVRSTPLLGLGSRLSACFLSPLPGSSRLSFS